MEPAILYEDPHIIVCEKPEGILTQSDRSLAPDMINILKNYLYSRNKAAGEPYIAAVHRLDRPVGGIMVFAKTPFAAGELSRQVNDRSMTKKYLAVVCSDLSGQINRERVLLTDYLVKDGRSNLSKITDPSDKKGKKAELYYSVISVQTKNEAPLSLLEIDLLTGRHHQIRLQTSVHLGGIYGDTKYNPLFHVPSDTNKKTEWNKLALYSCSLTFRHPKTKKELTFKKSPKSGIFALFP